MSDGRQGRVSRLKRRVFAVLEMTDPDDRVTRSMSH